MKICLINNLYKPFSRGGAEQAVAKKAKKLVQQGHTPIIITTKPWDGWGSWKPKVTYKEEVKIYRFWSPNLCWYKNLSGHGIIFKSIWHLIDIFNFISASIVHNIIRKENPEIINTHNLMGISFLLPKMLNSMNKIYVHTLHDVQLVEPSGILAWNHKEDNLFQKIHFFLMKRLFDSPDKVNSPSKFLKNFYQKRGFFKESEWQIKKFELKQSKSIKPKQVDYSRIIKFLFVGSLESHKGVTQLMHAWDEYISTVKELHIVGDGIYKQQVRNWANYRQGVKVYGRVKKSRLDEIYNQSDVLIFPSICIENSPQVIKEALSHDLFIVASRTGGVVEFDEYNIWFFEPGNIEEMKKKIAEVSVNVLIKRGLSTEKKDQDNFEITWAKYFVDYINKEFNTDFVAQNNEQQNSDVDVFAVSSSGEFDTLNIQLTQIHPELFYEQIGGRKKFGSEVKPTRNYNHKTEIEKSSQMETKIKYLLKEAIDKKQIGYANPEDIVLVLQGYFQVDMVRRAIEELKEAPTWNFKGIYYVFPGINRGGVVNIKSLSN
ncbi:MAG: hypothetical protein BRC22_02235 [Parcubacteria group bacterium QH_9_35_7]|nr:MAG: hypothetical protein BRC22_02235 [Parcubacteria group bacterium QH_9_35_7]